MLDIERQQHILRLLEQQPSIRVNRLSELLYVSPPTVRRDLRILEQQGKVLRTHGGVMLRQTAESEIPLLLREEQNNRSKQIIARKAAVFVKNGDVVFLDASSTAAYLIPHLKGLEDIIVVTNSPKTSIRLGEAHIKNYCTGGLLLNHSVAYVGSEAEQFVASINADVLFFSTRGYQPEGQITDSSIEEVTVKRAMMKQARRCFYLCDSSKKGKTYIYNVCRADEVTAVIDETA